VSPGKHVVTCTVVDKDKRGIEDSKFVLVGLALVPPKVSKASKDTQALEEEYAQAWG